MQPASVAGEPQRSLEELVTLYELEPDVRDIYVEGTVDVRIVRALLDEYGARGVSVYDIDAVAIPVDMVTALGFELPNKRAEVIALATALAPKIPQGSCQLTCVADRDLDATLGLKHTCHLLMYTDFACMEAYIFDEVALAKLLRFCGYRHDEHHAGIFHSFCEVLRERHCHRIANEQLGWRLSKIELRKFLVLNEDRVTFDTKEYRTRIMNKNGRAAEVAQFDQAVKTARIQVGSDQRAYAHGHDLIELLEWFFHEAKCIAGKAVAEVVSTAVYCTMEFRKLGEFGLFKALLTRVGGSTASPTTTTCIPTGA